MTIHHKEKSKALLELLQWVHAEQYCGLDDDMPDNCNDWIGDLEEEEVVDICISVFREGI